LDRLWTTHFHRVAAVLSLSTWPLLPARNAIRAVVARRQRAAADVLVLTAPLCLGARPGATGTRATVVACSIGTAQTLVLATPSSFRERPAVRKATCQAVELVARQHLPVPSMARRRLSVRAANSIVMAAILLLLHGPRRHGGVVRIAMKVEMMCCETSYLGAASYLRVLGMDHMSDMRDVGAPSRTADAVVPAARLFLLGRPDLPIVMRVAVVVEAVVRSTLVHAATSVRIFAAPVALNGRPRVLLACGAMETDCRRCWGWCEASRMSVLDDWLWNVVVVGNVGDLVNVLAVKGVRNIVARDTTEATCNATVLSLGRRPRLLLAPVTVRWRVGVATAQSQVPAAPVPLFAWPR